MIPKIIHFCWLSNDSYPEKIQKCIDSWHKYLPDYEFIHWNFDRFPRGKSKWVDQAFDNKKYAFAADYIRLYALYNYGGIYLDTDVEVLKSFDPLLVLKEVLCFEHSKDNRLEVATIGVSKGSNWIKCCLDYYDSRCFVKEDGTFDTVVLPLIVKNQLLTHGYQLIPVSNIQDACKEHSFNEIIILPYLYFSPKSYDNGKIESSEKTFSIHHFAASWKPWYDVLESKFWHFLGLKNFYLCKRIAKRLK